MITGAGSGIGRALAVNVAGKGALLALSDVDEAGLAETVDLVKNAGAREVRSDRARRGRPRRVDGVRRRRSPSTSAGSTSWSTTPASRWPGDFEELGVRRHRLDRRHQLLGRRAGHQGVPAAPDRLRRRARRQHLRLFGLVSRCPGQSAYNATKYAVRGFSEALREEMLVAGHPVGVTVVHPGGIKTAIARNARVTASEDQAATAQLFDKKLATMTPERAAEIIVDGMLAGQGAGARRPRRPRCCTTWPSCPAPATRTSSPAPTARIKPVRRR